MSSPPSSVKQRSPKRSSSQRTPLRERTPSQANEISARLSRQVQSDQENVVVYNTTPFPTKPAHVLLPSSLKKQRGGPGPASQALPFPFDAEARRVGDGQTSPRGAVQPTVKLKRSVKALRDLYESQAEETSRPSTATSPPLGPTTSNSSRLRSFSSNDSLSGAYAWQSLRKISSDDLALLPTLPAKGRLATRISPRNSIVSQAAKVGTTSSPNFRVLGVSSSSGDAASRGLSDPATGSADGPSSDSFENSCSSPNVVRLGHTSSTDQLPISDQSSSPNVIKLGTSSPTAGQPQPSSYFSPSRSSSSSSRKRKRWGDQGSHSFAPRSGARHPLPSSPPGDMYVSTSAIASSISSRDRAIASSDSRSLGHAESLDESSSVVQILGRDEPSSDGLSETHASLQSVLSSSPPRIQYPIVHAPPPSQRVGLVVPKRNSRSMSTELSGPKYSNRLSAVPSEGSWIRSRPVSNASSVPDDLDEYLTSDELAPASTYILNNQSACQSQIRVVRDSDSDLYAADSHEATDEVTALPTEDYGYKSPPLRHARSGSYISSATSSHSRLNSMKSFTLSRQNSFISSSLRPSSSGSTSSNAAVPVPSWARRYYSGIYRDSFQYLYASATNLNKQYMAAAGGPQTQRTANSANRTDIVQNKRRRLEEMRRSKARPKIEARQSHVLPGVGPLVSNPVRGPATAAMTGARTWDSRRQSYPPPHSPNSHGRSVSAPLPMLDPRAHWTGMIEIHQQPLEDGHGSTYTIHHHHYARPTSLDDDYSYGISRSGSQDPSVIHHVGGFGSYRNSRQLWDSSPHLHHDHRLNTGSTESRGFGFPFNQKSRWMAPSVISEPGRGKFWLRGDLRTAQIACFTIGFVCPLTWFVGALLPLPKRPATMQDIEKAVYASFSAQRQQQQSPEALGSQPELRSHRYSGSGSQQQHDQSLADWEEWDVIDRLRFERQLGGVAELRWQNARWWRRLNRWMCTVGVVVCIVVVVLVAVFASRH
ncbi:hypothetical protein HRR83_009071 [Exophiala dermatitidis]|uniref:Serine-rich protein n=2 Tax=Exophiala dermatitidis TaxID=5970 RepID=H6BWS9_EXODN|nr:uncharacterized protein HMPREF1120_03414 [Exophiala dermatitidis NIH/UT8656]KAJ4503177.1 hypothetical protein HRR73_009188 [Exophiala dermatitidis]EHY55270.1 hypothetical protein HMPREF1120_03414 [Exophiala dermatitidis NIH/UT8656]KAJ4506156.1 hypothetical protein HRR75_007011 [Exophiala dermatitidis]KAJ4508244.1 hypothetical protein HRR74_007643 [Exophiala dermatitidis]KAJ4533246.1 hypothetical protein HRR77_008778 [Exophiala dermatitidis]